MLLSSTLNGALRLIGVLAAGEEASAVEARDALDVFNGMIDGFNIDGLTISTLQDKSYVKPLLGWKSAITIGSDVSNDYVETAPMEIHNAFFRDVSGVDYKINPMGVNEWSDMVWKAIVAPPLKYFANYHGNNLTLQFDTIPYDTFTLHLICKAPYSVNYAATDDIEWDMGFEPMLRYQLAVRLSAEYGVQLRQDVVVMAMDLMRKIKRRNTVSEVLSVDIGLQNSRQQGYYHIESGTTR
jgi:hypothetical protein